MPARLTRSSFGATPDGRAVHLYTMEAAGDAGPVRLALATYGGHLVQASVPDRDGRPADVTLGYDDLAGYLADQAYFGATVGRYANRIARGEFSLDGKTYHLAKNNGPNALHGGVVGFNRVLWDAEPFDAVDAVGVVLRHTSPDGDQGYPGALVAAVTYTLRGDGALAIDYEATSDRPTVVNLTQHAYWNLAGHAAGSVEGHELTIVADRFTPVDATQIPTGELRAVAGTPFDFTRPHRIGERINAPDEQLRIGLGYDHNWVLRDAPGALAFAARAYEPAGGRVLEVRTTEPGLQFYSGNVIPMGLAGKGGAHYAARGGFALETQHFPDSPNQPAFPSTTLRPGETYRSRTEFHFVTDARG